MLLRHWVRNFVPRVPRKIAKTGRQIARDNFQVRLCTSQIHHAAAVFFPFTACSGGLCSTCRLSTLAASLLWHCACMQLRERDYPYTRNGFISLSALWIPRTLSHKKFADCCLFSLPHMSIHLASNRHACAAHSYTTFDPVCSEYRADNVSLVSTVSCLQ